MKHTERLGQDLSSTSQPPAPGVGRGDAGGPAADAGGPAAPRTAGGGGMGVSVTPHALNSEEISGIRLLSAGVDTFDLGFYVRWPNDRMHRNLERAREAAIGTDGFRLPGESCLVLPGGKAPMYRYHLQYADGHIFLARSPELRNFPNAYVSISAKSLWLRGVVLSLYNFNRHIESLGGTVERMVPSRVDLAADFHVPQGLTLDVIRSHLVTCSRTTRHYEKNSQLQTFYIGDGSSPVQMRIYDKISEIIHSGKTWQLDCWPERITENVWRIEGQFRRTALKEFGIHTPDDLGVKLTGLWTYLISWASLRLHDNPNRSRCTLHPLWNAATSATERFGDPTLVFRQRQSTATAPVDWYISHIAGCLVGFAARLNITDLPAALRAFDERFGSNLHKQQFADKVQNEMIRLGQRVAAEDSDA